MLIRMIRQTRRGDEALRPGDTVEVDDTTARRWIRKRIAEAAETESSQVPKQDPKKEQTKDPKQDPNQDPKKEQEQGKKQTPAKEQDKDPKKEQEKKKAKSPAARKRENLNAVMKAADIRRTAGDLD